MRYVPALPACFPADCDTEAMQVQGCINVTHLHFYDDDDDACSRVLHDCSGVPVVHGGACTDPLISKDKATR